MSTPRKSSKSAAGKNAAASSQLLPERELLRIIETVLRLAKSTGAEETEVHVDETAESLTRFANNAIHQNVAERSLNVSIRTVVDSRTARATTNRVDEDSLRAAIEASLSLAHSQPKDPHLLPLPGKQRYRKVNRFVKDTAALTPEDRARAVRRACDLAIQNGQVAAGIFASGLQQSALGNSRGLFAAYRETHAEFSITMQESAAASWAKANAASVRAFDPQKLA
ncbi:MAG: DNA gyrase modulator, partial [Candidatus Acidiferrum sp.]